MIHLYCGDGKGKTTAAVGLAARAAGSGKSVVFAQFLKDGSSGELNVLREISRVTVLNTKGIDKFTFQMNEMEKAEADRICTQFLAEVFRLCEEKKVDVLVLDEVAAAVDKNMIPAVQLRAWMEAHKINVEIVLTGRMPAEWMTADADYVTEMKKIKHPFDRGVSAREGIEY